MKSRSVLWLLLVTVYLYSLLTSNHAFIPRLSVPHPMIADIPNDNSLLQLKLLIVNQVNHALLQVDNSMRAMHRQQKAKGVLLALARNSELEGMLYTINQIERSFNAKYQYPYLFLNDVPFSQEFEAAILNATRANVEFGLIPKEHWSVPDWIDKGKLQKSLKEFKGKVSYGGLESYRHMCRFNSGFFYKQPLIQKYDYYWRVRIIE